MDIYTDEIFGPVLCVLRVDTLNEAIALIRTNRFAWRNKHGNRDERLIATEP
jgi:acyl-CoA reductase-like NAD-dependent aldehyde dehydrogenase